ncbi:MAG: hypothetical protein V4805_17810 [Pseudomonadota bacterium]
MNDKKLIESLRTDGRVSDEHVTRWAEAAGLMAAIDAIGRDGVNAIVKIDGARTDGQVYTIVLSGAKLGESFFRRDGSDLLSLLQDAIEFYRSTVWLK